MPIPLHISPRIIPSIASLYNDVSRIFMEYIDNAIDSAEACYEEASNSYSRPIEISLTIKGNSYKDGKVFVVDNCFGITNFTKVVESVGDSDKKAQTWTNGQFGYGIYSFMAACAKLEITSKIEKEKALYIPINRKQFNADKQGDVSFPDPETVKDCDIKSGTVIRLSNFDKNSWKQIDMQEVQDEIERHFELLLARNNITIKLVVDGKEEYICKAFDYSQHDGEIWEDNIKELTVTKGRRYRREMKLTLPNPIYIFLKITRGKEINKRPVFICKGRRIGEIKDIKSFKSKHKSELWDHPNVTGYIDLSDFLEPTIARNDFKNNDHSRALFSYLNELEPVILEEVKNVNKQSEERHYQELEDRLNQALSRLAKLDSMSYRTDHSTGNTINLEAGGAGQSLVNGTGSKDHGDPKPTAGIGTIGENEGQGQGVGEEAGSIPGGELGGSSALNKESENPFEDTGFRGGERKKSGFNIRIDEREPDTDDLTGWQMRSNIYGNEIRIFKTHPDFQERVVVSRRGETRITPRLITYLAGEITVHYKHKFHTRKGTQPEYSKNHFNDLVGFIYQFEKMLKDLSGKNLSDLEN